MEPMGKTLIKVETYSGYKADERPLSLTIGKKVLKVEDVLDRWYGEGNDYFKLKADDGYSYIIRHDRDTDEWDLVMMEAGKE
jgi:hypothetical protein